MAKKDFKVVIVGGSVAGLSMANMLERLGIDFVVLEAHRVIAPQLGASIGVYPCFARLLDQIGCYEPLLATLDGKTIDQGNIRTRTGKSIFFLNDVDRHHVNRHGYRCLFIERQALIQGLYDQIKQKDKVLLEKRVSTVESSEEGACVTTTDGSRYEGDIVVGADGMHSVVRKEMHRLGKELSPGHFDDDEYSRVLCEYRLVFGISTGYINGVPPRSNHYVMNDGFGHLVIGGAHNRTYWFLMSKNEETTHGTEVPRYTLEDGNRLAEAHLDDPITEESTFRDVFRNRIHYGMTPIHEYQWKKWHFGRITTIGDSAHKLNPITGFGGDLAMEGAAALVNALTRKLDERPGTPLSLADIDSMFAEAQASQEDRVRALLEAARKKQRLDTAVTFTDRLVARFVIPRLTQAVARQSIVTDLAGAVSVEKLPLKKTPRYVPYEDELPARPMREQRFPKVLAALAFAAILYASWALLGGGNRSATSASASECQYLAGWRTGINWLDMCVCQFVQESVMDIAREDKGRKVLETAYSLASVLPATLIWTIDGYRLGNTGALITWPTGAMFSFALLLLQPSAVIPLYYLFTLCAPSTSLYHAIPGRPMPVSSAMGITQAVVVGFVGASLLSLIIPSADPSGRALGLALRRFAPLIVILLTPIFSKLATEAEAEAKGATGDGKKSEEDAKPDLWFFRNEDVPQLKVTYRFAFFVAALAHAVLVSHVISGGSMRLSEAVGYDLALCALATVVWSLYTAWEVRRLGYATTEECKKVALKILVGSVIVGPGAACVGTREWRENTMAGLSK